MSSVKKESLGNLSAASLDTAYKCGECLHHKKHAHPSFKSICAERGIKGIAIAPKCFTPDVSQVAINSDLFVQLAALLASYTPKQKRIMNALLKQKPSKRFKHLPFGTKMYFLGLGGDYISNYLAGYVMGTTSGGELILTGSPEQNTRGRSYMAYMTDDEMLLTPREWKAKKAELVASGRIRDPKNLVLPRNVEPGDPVTIDSAPQAWHDKQERKMAKGRKAKADLTEIIRIS